MRETSGDEDCDVAIEAIVDATLERIAGALRRILVEEITTRIRPVPKA